MNVASRPRPSTLILAGLLAAAAALLALVLPVSAQAPPNRSTRAAPGPHRRCDPRRGEPAVGRPRR